MSGRSRALICRFIGRHIWSVAFVAWVLLLLLRVVVNAALAFYVRMA